jgi:hypothetical protein
MEPITTTAIALAAADLVKDEAKTIVVDWMKEHAIGYWSEKRAKNFLDSFVDEVRKEMDVKTTSATLNDMLKAISKTDKQTSALFDAYRRVALSASKDLGPIIIGLQTAKIVLEDRDASDSEERVFEAASVLNDRDFTAFLGWMDYVHSDDAYCESLRATSEAESDQDISFLVSGGSPLPAEVNLENRSTGMAPVDKPLHLYNDIGPFALKLKNVGVLGDLTRGRDNILDLNAADYYVLISPACEGLYKLTQRAFLANG